MTESGFPDVMEDAWSTRPPQFPSFRVTLTFVDEFGMPVRPRGAKVDTPSDPKDFERFAEGAAEMVRRTVLDTLENPR